MKLFETNKENLGFTLIELLVVIAIIGILSSVVLTSLSGARQSAKEASILQNLSNARTQATMHYNNNGSYSGLCQNTKIQDIVASASSTSDKGAECWVSGGDLSSIDWGVATSYDDTYYAASPEGVATFDDANISYSGGWEDAKTACANKSKRVPTTSELKAIYEIESSTPAGFPSSHYWSSLDYAPTAAYKVGLDDGWVNGNSKSSNLSVRCVK